MRGVVHSYLERETKLDVAAGFREPDLAGLIPDGARIEAATEQLRSEYFDTTATDLRAAGMTLRHRTGTADEGWHLKVPRKVGREELRAADAPDLPDEVRCLVRGVTRDAELRPVAVLTTVRRVRRIRAADGELLAEIADDEVSADALGEQGRVSTWREVEIELGSGEEDLLYDLAAAYQDAGAFAAASWSKLDRALGRHDPETAPGALGPALNYLRKNHRRLLAGDVALRSGQADVVHKTRVAVRRTRSTLRTFGGLFEPGRTARLDDELRWYAGLLGDVRDRQVLRKRYRDELDKLPDELILGPVRARIDSELGGEQAENWEALVAALDSDRYMALLDELGVFVTDPPLGDKADRPVQWLTKRRHRAERRVVQRLEHAAATGNAEDLHRARKAAKRARYAAELLRPNTEGRSARKSVKRHRRLQDLLGEHQDAHVSQGVLRRLGAKAAAYSGENGFTYGVLYEQEQARTEAVGRQVVGKTAKVPMEGGP
jgi:CHAD domain-containing protein